MNDHEYAVIGHSRAVWGRYLGAFAAGFASILILGVSALMDKIKDLPVISYFPDVFVWPLTAGVVFAGVYIGFNQFLWRWPVVTRFLNIPDLNGDWTVSGETRDQLGNVTANWVGTATIRQSWEKINVHLKTPTSTSRSKAAALVKEPGSYLLMYSYRNDPAAGEPMNPHVGYAELSFDEKLHSGHGDYFNNKGRVTFGKMSLTRKDNTHGR